MSAELNDLLELAKDGMNKALEHLSTEMSRIRAGKANVAILDGIMVEAYGAMTPLNQLGNISTPDSKTLAIQAWDKSLFQPIEKAILMSNLGLNPQNDGEMIRLYLPPLTEERRKELVKQVKAHAENTKVSVRNVRRDTNDMIKKLQKDGLGEDVAKGGENQVQELTNSYIAKVDKLTEAKEKEILTV